MMHQATMAIYAELKKYENLKVFTDEGEKSSEVWLQFGIDNGGSYRIKFISIDEDNDVAVRVYSLLHVKEDKITSICKAINEINCRFRYVKFCCTEDGNVNVEYDFPVSCSNPAESAREIITRLVRIIDEAYPLLMRAMWS